MISCVFMQIHNFIKPLQIGDDFKTRVHYFLSTTLRLPKKYLLFKIKPALSVPQKWWQRCDPTPGAATGRKVGRPCTVGPQWPTPTPGTSAGGLLCWSSGRDASGPDYEWKQGCYVV